jgi:sodium/bile acid cotransporter 7
MGSMIVKRWFLLTVVIGCLLAWVWPDVMAWTRWANPRLVMPLALFLMAVTMPGRSLVSAVRRPAAALWAVLIGYVVPPLLGWAVGGLVPGDFHIGVVVCCCAPCTLASAVLWTRLAGGNEAVALFSTFISTGLSWLATTAWLALLAGTQVSLDYPAMMLDLAITLVAPVALGQLLRALLPFVQEFATARKPALGVVSRLLVLVIMLRTAYDVTVRLQSDGVSIGLATLAQAAAICLSIHLFALFFGLWSSRRIGFDEGTQIAVAFAGSQKTLPVSLVILDLYFPTYPLAVVPVLFYHAGQLTADTWIAERWASARALGKRKPD